MRSADWANDSFLGCGREHHLAQVAGKRHAFLDAVAGAVPLDERELGLCSGQARLGGRRGHLVDCLGAVGQEAFHVELGRGLQPHQPYSSSLSFGEGRHSLTLNPGL